MTQPKKLLFFQIYSDPPIAKSVGQMLAQAFAHLEVDTVVITSLLKRHPLILLANVLWVMQEFGPSAFRSKRVFVRSMLTTTFMFRQVKRLAAKYAGQHDENIAFTFMLQSMFDCSVTNIPHYVYTDHTHLANEAYSQYKHLNRRTQKWIQLEHTIYHNAQHTFTRSHNISKSLVEQYGVPEDKIRCVYAGSNAIVDTAQEFALRAKQCNILFVGIDWERKGGPDLVTAFEQLLPEFPTMHLTIVGCEPAGLNLPNCTIVGRVSVEEVHQYFAQATIFCLPTKNEPFGVVFVEALAHRLPIVGTNIGAIPDFVHVNQNGFLIEPGDTIALRAALRQLLRSESLRIQFSDYSAHLANSRYNWQCVGNEIRGVVGL